MELVKELEINEVEYWKTLYFPDRRTKVDPEFREIGPYYAFRIPGIDILAYNRVLTGNAEAGSLEKYLRDLIRFYGEKKIPRFFVQLNAEADKK